MQRPSVLAAVIVILSISIISVKGGNGGWGATCDSSQDCITVLTCQKSFLGNLCLCPGTLVADSEKRGCQIAPGDFCKKDQDCVSNSECVQKTREHVRTCQCIQGMKMNAVNHCEPETSVNEFIENAMNYFSGLGAVATFCVVFVFTSFCCCVCKICCGGKK